MWYINTLSRHKRWLSPDCIDSLSSSRTHGNERTPEIRTIRTGFKIFKHLKSGCICRWYNTVINRNIKYRLKKVIGDSVKRIYINCIQEFHWHSFYTILLKVSNNCQNIGLKVGYCRSNIYTKITCCLSNLCDNICSKGKIRSSHILRRVFKTTDSLTFTRAFW